MRDNKINFNTKSLQVLWFSCGKNSVFYVNFAIKFRLFQKFPRLKSVSIHNTKELFLLHAAAS